MDLSAKIDADYKEAMLARDEKRVGILRLIRAAFKNEAINLKKVMLTAEEATAVLRREAKKRREAIEFYQKGARADLSAKEEAELVYLEGYLPAQLSEDNIKKVIADKIQSLGNITPTDFGKIMPLVMAELKGRADGQLVNKLVREIIAKT